MEENASPKSKPVVYCAEEEIERINNILDDAMADIRECFHMLDELRGCMNEISARVENLYTVE